MSGFKQVCACWDMSWGVTYAASAQCDSNCQSDNISSEPVCELSAGVLLLHDNVPVHMSAKSQAASQPCGFQQLNHPPYIQNLAPSDYFLFRVMKKFLRGKRFFKRWRSQGGGHDLVWRAVKRFFFSRGIMSLQQKWARCIKLLGDYIEK